MRKISPRYLASILAIALSPLACSKSSPTDPPQACTYTFSQSSLTFAAGGGSNPVTVNTAANCAWSATSDRGWMAVTAGSSGSGTGTVTVSLTPNSDDASRTGTLTVAGKAVSVVQEGLGPCTFELSPAGASFSSGPATGSFAVSYRRSRCQWSAASSVSWVTVSSGGPRTGSGSVAYAIA